ncbi:MAG TPA: sulfite exporter TauE/SafE family protein [Streptosporangiaceae bacterium]
MNPLEMAGLVAAGALAGLVSTVASVASVVSYPVLLAIGLPPLAANVTNTVALLFTGAGAAAGSRPELTGQRARLLRLGPACVLGGAVGSAVLLLTPASWFGYAAPVLIAAGSVILLIPRPTARARAAPDPAGQNPPTRYPAGQDVTTSNPTSHQHPAGRAAATQKPAGQDAATPTPHEHPADQAAVSWKAAGQEPVLRWGVRAAVAAVRDPAGQEPVPRWGVCAAAAGVACYIGYFGAAGGILMLALLAATQAGPLPRANAAKNVLNGLANAAAAVAFAWFGPVDWAVVPPLAAGFLAGGAVGPAVVRRMPVPVLRAGVAVAGLAIAIKLGAAAYGHAAAPSRPN